MNGVYPPDNSHNPSHLPKILGCTGCGCSIPIAIALLALAFVGTLFWSLQKVKETQPYSDAITAVQTNSNALEALGSPITPGFSISASFSDNSGQRSVEMRIPVRGPKGKGEIQMKGTQSSSAAPWVYSTLQLDVEDGASILLKE